MRTLVLIVASFCSSCAFSLLSPATQAPALISRYRSSGASVILHAESGAPQYEKVDGFLREAVVLGKGSVMLHIDAAADDRTIEYQPGHVIALEIEAPSAVNDDSKNSQDAKTNGGWMRGPYTVSRGTTRSFDVLIRVVGEKSKLLANAEPGTPVRFGGKFHVPIVEGIRKDQVKRVVFISTGVGIGPCVGAVETVMRDSSFPPIQLCASFKEEEDIVYGDYLNELAADNPERFSWNAVVSNKVGRLSASEENLNLVIPHGKSSVEYGVNGTHYHLIGNGQMVNEFKAGLAKAGVPDENVTVEMYFNHKAPVNEDVVNRIARVLSSSLSVETM